MMLVEVSFMVKSRAALQVENVALRLGTSANPNNQGSFRSRHVDVNIV
jgi:hypothetical protein